MGILIMKYFEGKSIGPVSTLLMKRLPKSRAIFKCSFCGKEFEAKISHIVDGSIRSCGCLKQKYHEGDQIGPFKTKLLKREKENRGEFLCSFCGKIFSAKIGSVVSGKTKSCGCQRFEDLSNQRFGKLIALKRTGNRIGTSSEWECQCDCGKTAYVSAHNLKTEHTKSCGCLIQNTADARKVELTNKKFGWLTALEPTKMRRSSSVVWKCQCDCGNICFVAANKLTTGRTQSCGCIGRSRGERKISDILKILKIKFIAQYRFNDCRDTLPLPFDFYLPDYNCCIEYDGEQHFHPTGARFTTERVKDIQKKDAIKNQYCSDNNINLIRIPYYDYNKINKEYLRRLLINE